MSVVPAEVKLTIAHGELWGMTIELDDGESAPLLDDKTVQAQIRDGKSIDDTIIATITCTDDGDKTISLELDDTARSITATDGYWTLFVIDANGKPDLYFYGPVEFLKTNTEVA